MPTTRKDRQRAGGIVVGRSKHRKRVAAAVCSWFVLLALAGINAHINGAELKVKASLSVEATFSTVQDHSAAKSPSGRIDALEYDPTDSLKAIWCARACVT